MISRERGDSSSVFGGGSGAPASSSTRNSFAASRKELTTRSAAPNARIVSRIAVAGAFRAELFDGTRTEAFTLDDPTRGLYIPRMVYIEMEGFSAGAVGLVLASTHYEIRRSLRSREAYLEALGGD